MPRRLLVGHFLRRLLENDLIAPGTDRHQVLSVALASLVTTGTFLSVAVSMKYLFTPIPSAGQTALVALDDVCLAAGLTMVVMAAVAVLEWDALSLDARDAAILGALPVSGTEVAWAQLSALTLFAGTFAVVLSAVPSVLMPLIRLSRLQVGLPTILRLVAAQGVTTVAAGALGFSAVIAVRETLRAVSGSTWHGRVTVVTQSALVVLTAVALLALPVISSGLEQRWLTPAVDELGAPPPVWFAGLYDWLGGERLASMPPTMPPADAPAFESILDFERRASARYDRIRGRLAAGGRFGLGSLVLTTLVAAVTWIWNARRLPHPPPLRRARTRPSRVTLDRMLGRHAVARGAARFALQTLSRSAPHRIALGVACGIGVAVAAVALRAADLPVRTLDSAPVAVFAAQPIVLVAIVVGFAQACRIPATLPATPSFLMAWPGSRRHYVAGIRHAGFLCGAAAVVLMAPAHALLLGRGIALWHAVFGVLMGGAMTSAQFRDQRLPLISAQEPAGNVVGLAPIFIVAAAVGVVGMAWTERTALQATPYALLLASVLALAWYAGVWTNRRSHEVLLSEAEESAIKWETQQLGLSD